ncbi:hypothetical protein K2X92_01455 [Candidatus Gracilibacteria bacterium]|nr:hypothetical protein [Candidatus Gracilibacteria bacterium]
MNVFDTIEFQDLIRYAIAIAVVFSILLAIGYIIWGGFLIILSAGSEEKVKSAVNHIRHAFLGIVMLFIILFVTPLITRLIGFEYGEYASPPVIFETITEVSNSIFGTSSGIDSLPTDSGNLDADFSNL